MPAWNSCMAVAAVNSGTPRSRASSSAMRQILVHGRDLTAGVLEPALDDAGERGIGDHAAGGGRADHVMKHLPPDARLRRQRGRLEGRAVDPADHRLQAGFDRLPHARLVADPVDRPADRLHERAVLRHQLVGARHHHRERSGLRAAETAADRRIDQADTGTLQPVRDLPGCRGADGRGQKHRRARPQRAHEAVLAEDHGFRLVAVHDHDEDPIRVFADFARARRRPAAELDEGAHPTFGEVEAGRLEPRSDQVPGQTAAHVAKPDHTRTFHGFSPCCTSCMPCRGRRAAEPLPARRQSRAPSWSIIFCNSARCGAAAGILARRRCQYVRARSGSPCSAAARPRK